MSERMQWSKFWWGDWARDPALRASGYSAKGLWMDMLCQMDAGEEQGFLLVGGRAATAAEIAKMVGGDRRTVERLLVELEANGVFSRDDRGAIFCRRMTRDHRRLQQSRTNGRMGGNPVLNEIKDIPEKRVKVEKELELEAEKKDPPKPPKGLADFDDWWPFYPRKDAKDAARKSYAAAIKAGATPEELLAAVKRYPFNLAEPQFIPMPTTWLNQGRWRTAAQLSLVPNGASDPALWNGQPITARNRPPPEPIRNGL